MSAHPPMDPDLPNQFVAKRSNATQMLLLLLGLATLVAFLAWQSNRLGRATMASGRPAPPIRADGWVNGDPPTQKSLANRVVLVEAWATWCRPCLAEAPHLVELHRQFADRGVIFIGLTSENRSSLPRITQFLKATGITWLNGWGATETLNALDNEYLPSSYVIGANGQIVWDSSSRGTVEEALELALDMAKKNAGG